MAPQSHWQGSHFEYLTIIDQIFKDRISLCICNESINTCNQFHIYTLNTVYMYWSGLFIEIRDTDMCVVHVSFIWSEGGIPGEALYASH